MYKVTENKKSKHEELNQKCCFGTVNNGMGDLKSSGPPTNMNKQSRAAKVLNSVTKHKYRQIIKQKPTKK